MYIKCITKHCKNMKHIGISVKIANFEPTLFVGYFKIADEQDLRKSAAVACKKYAERKKWADFLARIKMVEVYDRLTNNELLKIEL